MIVLKKLTSQNQLNKLAKSTLAVVLAGTFTLSASQVFAEGTTSQQENYQTVDLQTVTSDSSTAAQPKTDTNPTQSGIQTDSSTTTPASDTIAEANSTTTQTQGKPSLIPGDFFYFVKAAFERIKLALTFNDVKKAKLLANYASERLAEAQALLASGQQQTAVNTIDQSLEDMKAADKIVDKRKKAAPTNTQVKDDSDKADDQNVTVDTVKTDEASSTEQVQGQNQTNDDKTLDEVNNIISQNIAALTAALDKVKNPVAKAALERNIAKSYAKLARKITKSADRLAEKKTVQADTNGSNQTGSAADNTTTAVSSTSDSAAGSAVSSNTNNTGSQPDSEVSNTAPQAKIDVQHLSAKQFHQENKQDKQKEKQNLKTIKQINQQHKEQKREEAKSLVDAKKAEKKQAHHNHED